MKARLSPIQVVRRVTLGISLLGLTLITILHQKIASMPSIDALDPFGGLETLLKYVAGGEFIKKIEPGNLVLFGGVIVLGVVLSRFFCGWFCAFGALQGVFGWLGKKLFRRRFTVPAKLDAVLRWVKYPLLAVIIYFTWKTGTLVIRPYEPLAAYGHLSAGLAEVWGEFAVGLVILIAILLLSMLYERAFCKYLCPLGAVNALLSRIPLFRIKRREDSCISCSACDRVCPMNVPVATAKRVDSPECIACMECVTACPTKKPSLVPTLGGKALRLGLVVGLGFAIYLGAAALGQATGMLRFSAPTLAEQARAGSLKVEDIKGSSTYAAVADSFGIELERLYREVGVDAGKVPPESMLKDTAKLAGLPGFETDLVRQAVARILGIPYTGESGEALPTGEARLEAGPTTEAAGAGLTAGAATGTVGAAEATAGTAPAPAPKAAAPQAVKPAPSASSAVVAEGSASEGSAPEGTGAAAGPAGGVAPSDGLKVPAEFVLEGTMSVNEVAAALGASAEAVLAKLGLPADFPRDKPLRELKDQYGYTMPVLKERFAK